MDKLNELIDAKALVSFNQDFLDNIPKEEVRAEALGVLIANWASWDVDLIVKVCVAALGDANAHSLEELLEEANC